ncbi:unnamed protein product [Caenorhabditis bovis]|uniref:Phosphate transporter n=1 Tax=Caenorhabditis bovis TaxID=2654633 RepID=A0A8S1F1R2_9PELO|nr:unnamed protein product [Caenorhabditis bovis]
MNIAQFPALLNPRLLQTTTTQYSSTSFKPIAYFNVETVQWAILFGVSFLLGVGMGGNDVADAFGTSVGTGTVTLTQAFILATVVEMMGALAAGWSGDPGRKLKIVDTMIYKDEPDTLIFGQIAILIACASWLLLATYYRMPVSSIHSLLGATLGFSIVVCGLEGVVWERVLTVVLTWLFSPVISAVFTLITFFLLDVCVLQRKNPVETGLFILPILYFFVIFINVFLLIQDGSRVLQLDDIALSTSIAISILCGGVAAIVALLFIGPYMKWKIRQETKELPRIASSLSYNLPIKPSGFIRKAVYWAFPPIRKDDQKAVRLFSLLQVITAIFVGFAHGANDIIICVSPIRDLIEMFHEDTSFNEIREISLYIGLLTALAALLGIWTLGIRVIETVGCDLSKINPATGFSVEFGAAITGLITNSFNIPQSQTHCLVASLIGLGLVRSGPILKWKTVKNVFVSWVLTIPISGLFSAAVMFLFRIIYDLN